MHSGEMWQEFHSNGAPTAASFPKQEFKGGQRICGASHVWLWRRRQETLEILLQQRADTVGTWPGYFDISAAGHINAGESPVEAALREGTEEIGVRMEADKLELLFCSRKRTASPGYVEINWIYAYEMTGDAFELSDGEVAQLEWIQLDELRKKISNPADAMLVPHSSTYFLQLLDYFELILSDRSQEVSLQ